MCAKANKFLGEGDQGVMKREGIDGGAVHKKSW